MRLHLPSRRAIGTAPTILKTLRPTITPPIHPPQHQQQQRTLLGLPSWLKGPSSSPTAKREHERTGRTPLGDLSQMKDRREAKKQREKEMADRFIKPRLESSSIFDEEIQGTPTEKKEMKIAEKVRGSGRGLVSRQGESVVGASLAADHMRRAVDPDPLSRVRWQRKMVIRHVTRCLDPKGKETRVEKIKRTEREVVSKSCYLPTSTKKLVHLSHQIAGKTVADARLQMQFSKKKMAREVLFQLDLARDQGVVERGMGLGGVTGEKLPGGKEEVKIQDKDGKWMKIDDPTRMYIAESWVTRGPWRNKYPDYRARGRTYMKKRPQATIHIRLKEEKTRIREYEERKEKEYRRGPWIHLPNRPVSAQRPFYSW